MSPDACFTAAADHETPKIEMLENEIANRTGLVRTKALEAIAARIAVKPDDQRMSAPTIEAAPSTAAELDGASPDNRIDIAFEPRAFAPASGIEDRTPFTALATTLTESGTMP